MEEELNKLTVVKLKERLSSMGLDTRGVKHILVKRLAEALTAQQQQEEEAEENNEGADQLEQAAVQQDEDTNDSEWPVTSSTNINLPNCDHVVICLCSRSSSTTDIQNIVTSVLYFTV